MSPALEVDNLSYIYPGEQVHALKDVSLCVHTGECMCFTGPSGSGKTTLFLAIKELLRGGEVRGNVLFKAEWSSQDVGMVFQNAESQILCTTVEDEAAFGPENLGLPGEEVDKRVQDALEVVGLAGFGKRNVEHLSAGEKHRLAIASVLTMKPALMLLDEPTGQLDAEGKRKLIDFLGGLKERGYCLLIADHNIDHFRSVADRLVYMEGGRIHHILNEFPRDICAPAKPVGMTGKISPVRQVIPAISMLDLHVSGPDRKPMLKGINVKINKGELIHLFGPNGAGKSTILKCMTGLITPDAGKILIAGIENPKPHMLLGKVGLLFQNAERQIFEDTVYAEVAFSLRKLGLSSSVVRERVMETLALSGISHKMDHPPLALSFGEQHRVALAAVIAPKPEILLLDEPFAGLDLAGRYSILRILFELRENAGTTVVIASHDPLPDTSWSDRILFLEDARIETS